MSIAKKLMLLVAGGQLALIFVTAFSWYTTYSVDEAYKRMIRDDYRQVELAMDSLDRLGRSVQAYKNCLIRRDPRYVDEFHKENAAIETSLKECAAHSDDSEQPLVKQALATHAAYRGSINELLTMRQANDDIAEVDLKISQGIDKPMRTALVTLAETSRRNIGVAVQELHIHARNKLYLMMGTATTAGLFLYIFGVMLVRNIKARIHEFSIIIGRVADNDLTVRFNDTTNDEVGRLGRSFQGMVNNLRKLIRSLAESSSQVLVLSNDMQTNALQMSNGAEEVVAQANTVATASEEMSATANDIARNCHLAAESAKRANNAANHGAQVVEHSIAVMHRISDLVQSSAATVEELGQRSDDIGSIVNTIEDIADQTNLLALNAAIEAARAGDQGRGFAVVADEVRALAERTAKATREIGLMITAIQQKTRVAVVSMNQGVHEVEEGTKEVERSGEALLMIQGEINTVNQQMQQIATAAEEQTATTSEISSNIHQITDVVHGTAAGAHKTSSAAEYLSQHSAELKKHISQFKISESVD